jgi:hypothetical protein
MAHIPPTPQSTLGYTITTFLRLQLPYVKRSLIWNTLESRRVYYPLILKKYLTIYITATSFSFWSLTGLVCCFSDVSDVYENATSSVSINGLRTGKFCILCSVLQCWPLSVKLFAIRIYPLLCVLKSALTGIRVVVIVTNLLIAYAK